MSGPAPDALPASTSSPLLPPQASAVPQSDCVAVHSPTTGYRGRLAPSPTGLLHLGHARTFRIAWQRAREHGGTLVFRNEDLDTNRANPFFAKAMLEDLRWLGIDWTEGPDVGGPLGPYDQSARLDLYRDAFERLRTGGWLFPCTCSRRDIRQALSAPHAGEEEPVYPGTCRQRTWESLARDATDRSPAEWNWRFRVPDGQSISWDDSGLGRQHYQAGIDFGDFIVMRRGGIPSYQLACVVDDAQMKITEVVRGADLLPSTARQLLLYQALGWNPPAFHHVPLMLDETGRRLAKRHDALSLRSLRDSGLPPHNILSKLKDSP